MSSVDGSCEQVRWWHWIAGAWGALTFGPIFLVFWFSVAYALWLTVGGSDFLDLG